MKEDSKEIIDKFFDGEMDENEKASFKILIRENKEFRQLAFAEYLLRKTLQERMVEDLNQQEIADPGFEFEEINYFKEKDKLSPKNKIQWIIFGILMLALIVIILKLLIGF